jgi:hypothetical protein
VQANTSIFLDAIVKRIRLPCFRKEHHANGLTEVVELETCAADCRQDRRVRNRLDLYLQFPRPQYQVRMRRRTKRIAHNEEGNILGVCVFEDIIGATLNEFTICEEDRAAIEGFLPLCQLTVQSQHQRLRVVGITYQFLFVNEEDAGVGFEVDALGSLDDRETFDSDIGLVCKAEADKVEHLVRIICLEKCLEKALRCEEPYSTENLGCW